MSTSLGFPGSSEQEANARILVGVGKALGAPELALVAMMCIGWGENNMTASGCNSSNHCGLFQLSPALQAQHDYTDVTYWARQAYLNGFWSYGGIIPLAQANPGSSPGYIANQCQGAYTDLAQGANYYNGYVGIADESLRALGNVPPNYSQGGGGTVAPVQGALQTQQVIDAIEADDWSPWLNYGAATMHTRAHTGYFWSERALRNCDDCHVFTTTGGH